MAPRRVLVTGMSGLIGGALRRHLEGTYELSALNRRSIPGVKCHAADIADLDAIAPAFAGVDTVVHLAARTGSSDVFDEILKANVVGTYNVFEAARRAGVSRVVYAVSDNRWGYRDLEHARTVLGFEPRDRAEDYRR